MQATIEKLIDNFINDYMDNPKIKTKWKKPIIGFADSSDSLFEKLKEVATPTHLLPRDLLPEAKTVIAYFIPFDEKVTISNIDGRMSSAEWATAYVETNKLISSINDYLIESIDSLGYKAAKLPPSQNMNYETLMSNWSNRHVAYVAGLGTFGLNNMLITEKGCCGRLGNVVTSIEIKPTKRPDFEYCLYKNNGSCAFCVDKCVNDALFENEFDRFKCFEICVDNEKKYKELGHAEVCGKCLAGVPCSFDIPI